jgi:hypothetical protein
MKKTIMTSAAAFAFVAGADAATVTFDTESFGGGDNVTFSSSEGGSPLVSTDNSVDATTDPTEIVFAFTGLDIFNNGGAYDGTLTIDVTDIVGSVNVDDNGTVSRFQIGNGESFTLSAEDASLVLTDSLGSSNVFLANTLTVSFDGFNRTTDAGGITGSDAGVFTGEGIVGSIPVGTTPTAIDSLDLTATGTAGGDINYFGIGGDFTVDVVPEPSSTALLGLGGLALILRRRK